MIDLVAGELHFVGKGVQKMFTFEFNRHHALDMAQPRGHVSGHRLGAGIAPAVAVHQALTGDQHRLAGCVGDTDQGARSLVLAVLVKGIGRLNLGVFAVA